MSLVCIYETMTMIVIILHF